MYWCWVFYFTLIIGCIIQHTQCMLYYANSRWNKKWMDRINVSPAPVKLSWAKSIVTGKICVSQPPIALSGYTLSVRLWLCKLVMLPFESLTVNLVKYKSQLVWELLLMSYSIYFWPTQQQWQRDTRQPAKTLMFLLCQDMAIVHCQLADPDGGFDIILETRNFSKRKNISFNQYIHTKNVSMTMWKQCYNMKGVTHSDEPTADCHPNLQLPSAL